MLELKTSGPFHTEKLESAANKLKLELSKIEVNNNFTKTIIKNIDAKEYKNEDDIKEILSKHVMSSVKFKMTIERMLELGVDTFVEIGPRKGIIRVYKTSK